MKGTGDSSPPDDKQRIELTDKPRLPSGLSWREHGQTVTIKSSRLDERQNVIYEVTVKSDRGQTYRAIRMNIAPEWVARSRSRE